MSLLDAGEVLAKMKEHGHDSSPFKQAYKTELYGDKVIVYHPTRTTAVGADGKPVNSAEDVDIPGRQYVSAPVTIEAATVEEYLAKGFTIEPSVPYAPPAKRKVKAGADDDGGE